MEQSKIIEIKQSVFEDNNIHAVRSRPGGVTREARQIGEFVSQVRGWHPSAVDTDGSHPGKSARNFPR